MSKETGGVTITLFHNGLSKKGISGKIIVGPDGNLWYLDWWADAIGRVTPDGTVTEFSEGIGGSVGDLVVGLDGNLWFTEWAGIGKITPEGEITTFIHPGIGEGRTPHSLVVGPDGNLWFTAIGEYTSGAIGRVKRDGSITEYLAGLNRGSDPTEITVGSDGNLWFADRGEPNAIGRVVPGDDPVETVAAPTLLGAPKPHRPGRLHSLPRMIEVGARGTVTVAMRCIEGDF